MGAEARVDMACLRVSPTPLRRTPSSALPQPRRWMRQQLDQHQLGPARYERPNRNLGNRKYRNRELWQRAVVWHLYPGIRLAGHRRDSGKPAASVSGLLRECSARLSATVVLRCGRGRVPGRGGRRWPLWRRRRGWWKHRPYACDLEPNGDAWSRPWLPLPLRRTLPDLHAHQQHGRESERCGQWSTVRHECFGLHDCPGAVVVRSGGWWPDLWHNRAEQRTVVRRNGAVPAQVDRHGGHENRDRLGHGFGWHAILSPVGHGTIVTNRPQ